jgi:hypothetical protein
LWSILTQTCLFLGRQTHFFAIYLKIMYERSKNAVCG